MTVQRKTIAREDQENALHCFWVMMSELDNVVDNGGCKDAVLKKQVEGFYRLWNKMTGSDNKPQWVLREEQKAKNG